MHDLIYKLAEVRPRINFASIKKCEVINGRLLRERLKVVDDLLADNRLKLERLLDLYLLGDFSKEMLTERKARLETTIGALQEEHDMLSAQIEARTLTREQIQNLQDFALQVAKGLDATGDNFETRRSIIEALNIQVTLVVEKGEKVAYARCILGDDKLVVAPQNQYTPQATTTIEWATGPFLDTPPG